LVFLLSSFEKAESVIQCELIPVGTIPERTFEIHKELIWLFAIVEKEYGKMLSLAPELIRLSQECKIENCILSEDNCPDQCEPLECPLGDSCLQQKDDQGNEIDICPPEIRKKMDEVFSEIKEAYDEISKVKTRMINLGLPYIGELSGLKSLLFGSKGKLSNFDQKKYQLFNWNEAKTFGLGCQKTISIIGIPISTLKPKNQFDYCLCKIY
jgi:hypothetical protein